MDQWTQLFRLHGRLRHRALRILEPPMTFLTLPLEIRLLIYESALEGTTNRTSHPLALLRVCRQVYSECYPIALPYIRLRLRRLTKFSCFWDSLDPKLKGRVKHLRISAHSLNELLFAVPAALKSSRIGLHLESLTVCLTEDVSKELWQWQNAWVSPRTGDITCLWKEVILMLDVVQNLDMFRIMDELSWKDPAISTALHSSGSWPYYDQHKKEDKKFTTAHKWTRRVGVARVRGVDKLGIVFLRKEALPDILDNAYSAGRLADFGPYFWGLSTLKAMRRDMEFLEETS
ncbi:hypothetical protein BCR34DRAFT_586520 [Clohesyomyces aquaticus]|uniref:Uncharacterized protein n=1 Tax=Clohesyomyces aquaticus TaxID=1231657 RepID=A0A1Y1ZSY3_9PLEO|nr:hypothetical protein BCR34DRAFT_586520 [Clohesyomyces aquaticus]